MQTDNVQGRCTGSYLVRSCYSIRWYADELFILGKNHDVSVKSCSKKLLAVLAMIIMLAVPAAAIITPAEDASAEDVDYGKYYYDQLGKIAKAMYDGVDSIIYSTGVSEKSVDIYMDLSYFTPTAGIVTEESAKEQLKKALEQAQKALINDNKVDIVSWLDLNNSISIKYTTRTEGASTYVNKCTLTVSLYDLGKSDTELSLDINLRCKSIEASGNRQEMVTQIHDYICNEMTYASDTGAPFVRCLWNALAGDHTVVCEGYAKAFKAACDYYHIPCIIVTGDAKGDIGETPEGHMWNYVLMDDGKWYLVDCTWDDQKSGIRTEYLLAGTETDGFNIKINESHNPVKLTLIGFTIPALSALNYGNLEIQYLVTYQLDKDGAVYSSGYVSINKKATSPELPVKDGYLFKGWYNTDDDAEWDFDTAITKDVTLYGTWEKLNPGEKVCNITFDNNGANETVPSIQVISGHKFTLPTKILTKDGYGFIGWNTNVSGNGITFEAGSEITVTDSITLYAAWEETEDHSPYKIDSIIESVGKFLSSETIKGLSNTNLTIGAVTIVVSLIAILLISRKE